MFIKEATVDRRKDGTSRKAYRIVEAIRLPNGKIRQRVVLHIGKDFKLEKTYWRPLCNRIKELLKELNKGNFPFVLSTTRKR
jgi:hypothetical protein